MSDQDPSQKTEEPSAKRLEEARERGQVAQSRDVNNLVMIAVATLVLFTIGQYLTGRLLLIGRGFLERASEYSLTQEAMGPALQEVLLALGFAVILPLLALMLAAFASGYLQFGLIFSTEPLQPKLEKVNPLSGIKRLVSARALVELVKGLIKIVLVAVIATIVLRPALMRADALAITDPAEIMPELADLTRQLLIATIVALVVVAGGDYAWQRFQLMRQLRMTKQELKDEFKQLEGDPIVKQKVRRIRTERSRRRMMAAVPNATVVVTNPTHYAVALKYERGMTAPMLVAKGADLVAHNIREIARKNYVPVVENPPVARLIYATVEIDEEIRPDQYKAVAEIIGYVYRLKRMAIGAR